MFKFKNKKSEKWFENNLELVKKQLFSFEKRKEMRNTFDFSETNNLWNDEHFNTVENIGQICTLTKDFHKKNCEHSYEEWEKYYLENGKNFNDIYKLSLKFNEKCNEKSISMDEQKALNFCYIRIIDESYIGYIRELNALARLKNSFSNKFGFTEPFDDMKCGIDIALYHADGRMIGGFQVKSKDARKRKRTDAENNRRFNLCQQIYNFRPIYLEIGEEEDISDGMKEIVKNYIIQQENIFK